MNSSNPNRGHHNQSPTVTHATEPVAPQRPVCEIPDCQARAVFRGTCSPDHYRERALRRRAALLGIRIDSPASEEDRTAVADAERGTALAQGLINEQVQR
jgi:hypothetical protein